MKRIEVYSSSLESEVFGMVALGALVTERTEKVAPDEMPALSVGQRGVTSQLDGVAKQTTDGSRKIVRSGDLVINSRADRRGASGVASQDGSVSLVYSVMKPNLNILEPRFGHHLLRSVGFQEEFFRWGTGIVSDLWSTNFTRMGRIRVPIPSLPTQRCIAGYLDRETGEIDSMIAKMDQLAEKLEARRVAAIRAYAGSSGGSEIRPLQWFATLTTGSTPTGGTKPENFSASQGIGWVTPEDLGGTVSPSRFLSSAALEQMTLVRAESTLVCGIGATVGKLGYTNSLVTTNQQITALIPHKHVHGRFLFYAMAAERSQLLANTVTTTLPIINNSRLGSLHIKSCAYDEQKRISDHLDEVTNKIDAMLAKVAELKSLLTERRAALITEVVTGRKEVA